jgi:hypothetical protein
MDMVLGVDDGERMKKEEEGGGEERRSRKLRELEGQSSDIIS